MLDNDFITYEYKKGSQLAVSYTQIPKPRLGIFFELFLGFMI